VIPVVAAYPVGDGRNGYSYDAVRADGSIWRWRSEYWSYADDRMVPATGWVRVAPPLTEMNTNAKEV